MRTATISFRVEIPEEATIEQLAEFLSFKFGITPRISEYNPLGGELASLNPSNLVVWGRGEDG